MSIEEQERYILNLCKNVIGQTYLSRKQYREEMRSIERFAVAVLPTIFRWVERNLSWETAAKVTRYGIGRNRPHRPGQIITTPWSYVEIWDEDRTHLDGDALLVHYASFVITAAIFDIFRQEQEAFLWGQKFWGQKIAKTLQVHPVPGCDY